MMRRAFGVALVLLAPSLGACGGEDAPPVDDTNILAPPAEGEGFQLAFDGVAEPYSELWLCQIGKFPAPDLSYVGAVESKQTEGVHHMDIMALTFTGVSLEPGIYECDYLYETYPALMEDGVFLYASQTAEQSLTLPPGVAAAVPGQLDIMYEMHYANFTAETVDVTSRTNIYLRDAETIEETIWGGAVRDVNINIPPMSEHVEWTRCVMNEDVDLLFLSSHTHELGVEVRVSLFDGETVAPEPLYQNFDWATPYLVDYTQEPLHIKKGTGFEFQCHYNNTRAEDVNWGFTAKDEMCQIALVHTPGGLNISCDPVESSDGHLEQN